MLSFLPTTVKGILTLGVMVLSVIFHFFPIAFLAIFKFTIPIKSVQVWLTRVIDQVAYSWIYVNEFMFKLTQKQRWTVVGTENLRKDAWYLVSSNHQSWADIFVLQSVFIGRIPFLKFFIKQELIWVPLIGIVWWAMDMPFMKRYSRAYLEKHPEKRGKDLETTRRSCEKFKETPTTVINFIEGTRRTPEKIAKQDPPYKHLLYPKAGGMAFVTSVMGAQLDTLLNVTIVYPENARLHYWDYLSGQVERVIVHVEEISIPETFFQGDYANDPEFRTRYQDWVNALWDAKDELIEEILQGEEQVAEGPSSIHIR